VLAGAVWRSPELQERLAGGLAATGLLLVALCERITLVDRMNTLFKIYNGVWYALAVALALLLASRLRSTRGSPLTVLLPVVDRAPPTCRSRSGRDGVPALSRRGRRSMPRVPQAARPAVGG
jgi:hypothetical protein